MSTLRVHLSYFFMAWCVGGNQEMSLNRGCGYVLRIKVPPNGDSGGLLWILMERLGVRFEVFTAVTMKNGVFWDVTPCVSCKNRRFEGT
jgi:hypothetical protein